MRVLFVYRGVGPENRNSVIDAQADSLKKNGLELECYPIKEGGLKGYIKSFIQLKCFLKKNHFDIVHGHYSISSIIAALTFKKKVIASLMGSDVHIDNLIIRIITKFFVRFIWVKTIVKSRKMKDKIKKSVVIPNGVNLTIFNPIDKKIALKKTGFKGSIKNIIFVAEDINSKVKNFRLAENAVKLINDRDVHIHAISNIDQEELVYYYNAADLLLLTSLSEGSPNVIKEAMACNCPIVSTDVGDVREIISKTKGCYITSFEPEDVAQKIKNALKFKKRTNGRKHIGHFDDKFIAQKIINIYKGQMSNCTF